ncbi:MAG: UDP-glucose 4-epimerase GalE, partial [Chloroflexota bacterium]
SHNLLSAMRAAGVPIIVFSSTAAVYGNPARLPLTEAAPAEPINPYGRSKLMVEQMLAWHAQAYGLRYVAFRYFNVAGATATHGEHH